MSALTYLEPHELVLAPYNPRRTASEESLRELAESILKQGLLQPVLVRPLGDKHEVVCGSRRTRAAILAGVFSIPVIVKEMSDQEAIEAALTENIQRTDVEPIEEVEAIEGLSRFYGTDQAIADRLGRSADWVSRRRKLLGLTGSLQESLRAKEFPLGWYEIACRLPEADQNKVLEYARSMGGPDSPLKLRAYLQRQSVDLTSAKFDISQPMGDRPACHGCPHNTASQADLFGADEPPRCQNRTCFDDKLGMFAERFAAENQVPLMQVDRSTYAISESVYNPETCHGYTMVMAGPGSAEGRLGQVLYVKRQEERAPGEPDPKAIERREYLEACKKENWIRAEMLLGLADIFPTMDSDDSAAVRDYLKFILHRATKPKGPTIRDSRTVSLDEFMARASCEAFLPGTGNPPLRHVIAYMIWRACHEEVAQKDWPEYGAKPQDAPALEEAYKALRSNYDAARALYEAKWADLPQNRKKEGAA